MPPSNSHSDSPDEPALVHERYARRAGIQGRYSLLNRASLLMVQERERAIVDLFGELRWRDPANLRLLEVGCGEGSNLLEFLRLGFTAGYLQGIELLGARAERARSILPSSIRIMTGDAAAMQSCVPLSSQDVVYQATVFSSLLDDEFQQRLASTMWHWVRPGGGVLWYDFTVNNPRNPDVRGVPLRRVRSLFPSGSLRVRRLTLAPPLARAVTRLHPSLYSAFNACPWLRTHALVWIQKRDK